MSLTFTCLEPAVCEDSYDSAWVRVRHGDGLVLAVEVIYSGKTAAGEPIKSSPMTLPQAIRMHSIRYGSRAPRLALGANENGDRVIVDVANGIAYLAQGALESSLVKAVRYVPQTDAAIRTASGLPLSENGTWLIKAARATRLYRNALADAEKAAESQGGTEISRAEITGRLEKMSAEARGLAKATLTLSGHVAEALEKHEQPDPFLASKLRKAFARLNSTTHEAMEFIDDHPDAATPEVVRALPLDLAGEAGARMKQLAVEGFAE